MEETTSASPLPIRDLSAAYSGRTVLHDVNLEVCERDLLGIIGPSGGGKTTLIKCVLGSLHPTGGEIVKHHESFTTGYLPRYSSIDRSSPILVLKVVLSELSLKKSLTNRFGDYRREKTRQVILRVGLRRLKRRIIEQLSDRQLRYTLLGRAITNDPRLFILDKPSTCINKRLEARLYQLLAEVSRDCVTILISHDIGAVLQQVKNIACMSETLDYHPAVGVSTEWLEWNLNCPIELLERDTPPHRILDPHCHCHENGKA